MTKTTVRFTVATCILTAGLVMGHKIGANQEKQKSERHARMIEKDLERFRNKDVFEHAQYVSQVTGVPLYQVLTGNQ